MKKLIGPVLRRDTGYAFDTADAESGLAGGETYRRIEDAYYARRAMMFSTGLAGDDVIVSDTIDDFNALVERFGKTLAAV